MISLSRVNQGAIARIILKNQINNICKGKQNQYLGGLFSRNSSTFEREGLNKESLAARASSNGTEPPIALRKQYYLRLGKKKPRKIIRALVYILALRWTTNLAVHSATAFPAPQNSASSSIPSSTQTVLSTSKHTASTFLQRSRISSNSKNQQPTVETQLQNIQILQTI